VRYEFDWDPAKEQKNIRTRRLSFRQASLVFRDPDQLTLFDEAHSDEEERWITIGLDSAGLLRVVVHTFKQVTEDLCRIRIISARKATSAEARQYQAASQ
jgi:hypothetical protein